MPREMSEARFWVEAVTVGVGTLAFMVCFTAAVGGNDPPIIVVGSGLVFLFACFVYALLLS